MVSAWGWCCWKPIDILQQSISFIGGICICSDSKAPRQITNQLVTEYCRTSPPVDLCFYKLSRLTYVSRLRHHFLLTPSKLCLLLCPILLAYYNLDARFTRYTRMHIYNFSLSAFFAIPPLEKSMDQSDGHPWGHLWTSHSQTRDAPRVFEVASIPKDMSTLLAGASDGDGYPPNPPKKNPEGMFRRAFFW